MYTFYYLKILVRETLELEVGSDGGVDHSSYDRLKLFTIFVGLQKHVDKLLESLNGFIFLGELVQIGPSHDFNWRSGVFNHCRCSRELFHLKPIVSAGLFFRHGCPKHATNVTPDQCDGHEVKNKLPLVLCHMISDCFLARLLQEVNDEIEIHR